MHWRPASPAQTGRIAIIPDMTTRTYDLRPAPRPVVARFTYLDGTVSADYAIDSPVLEVPDGVLAVEIRQLPLYPMDYRAGDEPGWGNEGGPAERLGEAAITTAEVRGHERFLRG